ncbi:M23 family metallopeptidase [Microbacterium rhizomatis]|uniref:M23 family metallopeptidase n=1 Tax=Microbacterium rhizomatis TaxID=1631477 RepID=A0A5J5J4W7_9MICO|nr:M23 family metallopeptidase [Microbacterium rhizomatis]
MNDSSNEPEIDSTSLTRRDRARRNPAPRTRPAKPRNGKAVAVSSAPPAPRPKAKTKPLRSAVILTVVAGLIATVALPAYAATRPASDAVTLQQASQSDAQSLVIASDATSSVVSRDSYDATTAAEIEQKKAEAAAAAAAAARAAAATTMSTSTSVPLVAMISPGSGEVRWPILSFTKGRGLWDSGYHQGQDLLAPAMTPIYAAAAGVVDISAESVGGYGVGIEIQHVIAGQQVTTMYGHMTYGTRQVQVGDTVAAGQLIGFVGSTGSSTANHLHFEVHVNGSVVDPWEWLIANAGPSPSGT